MNTTPDRTRPDKMRETTPQATSMPKENAEKEILPETTSPETALPKAALIVIGNEILSGRTQDANTKTLAKALTLKGIILCEVRIIPDDVALIASTVLNFSGAYEYVFTTGGIGPTHDDKTAEAIASAFNTSIEKNDAAYQILVNHYGGEEHMNQGRIKMACLPKGASMIKNPLTAAPGIKMNNVYVMAGVPSIMSAMLDTVLPTLKGGAKIQSRTIECPAMESTIAADLEALQSRFKDIEVGSYPKYKDGVASLQLVLRGTNEAQLNLAEQELREIIKALPCAAQS